MENFVLYHEIYKKDGMIMYKGRKKGTITYVAVSCIEKEQRIKVTNHVRIVFELDHKHVVKFYEWYETSNHLWLVTDLCVGGSLQQMIAEDVSFPESSIRLFGAYLIRGLHYLHSRGVICVQWHPGKIVLDGNGLLKYFDFSDAKKLNEDHAELVERFFNGLNIDPRDVDELFDFRKPTPYTAPELLQGDSPDFLSDIWGLGCVFYEMFTGQPPFGSISLSVNESVIAQNIVNNPLIIPRVAGARVPVRASAEFTNLLEQMLHKNRDSRITLTTLLQHPFWQGSLNDLVQQASGTTQAALSVVTAFTDVSVRPKTASQPANTASDDGEDSTATNTVDDVSFTLHLGSRPTEAAQEENGSASAARNKRTNKFQLEPSERANNVLNVANLPADQQELLTIATSSSADASSRVKTNVDDYARMLKDGRLKYDPKLLPISPFTLVKLKALRKAEREKHVRQIETAIKTTEKGPPSQRRLHLVNYLSQISMATEVSTFMAEAGMLAELARQLRSASNQDLQVRLCQALAIIFHHTSPPQLQSVSPWTPNAITESLVVIGDVLRDQFRCVRIKIASLAALGEGLVRLAEICDSCPPDQCEPPSFGVFITLINRCLHRNEDITANLIASRTVELVANFSNSALARQIANPETIQQLYSCYKHATVDPLKMSSVNAMSRLTRLDSMLFCGLIEKIGTIGLLENLHVALLSVQESVLEMFSVIMLVQTATTSVRKLAQDASFLRSIMRLLETPAPLVRAKSFLLVLLLCRCDLSLLKIGCEHRLVLYLERELKRINTNNRQDILDAIEQCLTVFTNFLSNNAVPTILEDCCSALQAVKGRRHPSSLQTKALRTSLPLLECVTNLTSSPSLRLPILSESFCTLLGQLLAHAVLVDNGQTTLGPDIAPQFITHVLALVESCFHSIENTGVLLVEHLLDPLAAFTGSTNNADIRIIGLKLCGDIINIIVHSDIIESHGFNLTVLANAMEISLLPKMPQFIIDPDPSAVYLLRLLRNYLQINVDQCISIMKQHSFPQLFVKLILDHQQRIMAAVVLESLLLISAIAQTSTDLLRDLVLDVDLIPILCDTLLEIGDVYHRDDMSLRTPKTSELLQVGMETLYSLAKLISDVVRRALQSKKNQETEEITARITSEAEELLGAGKPLTENVDLLIYTLSSAESDSEVVESSVKLLNQIVSLYGGQQIHHGLHEVNLQYLCNTITKSPIKQKRTLLRILKRLLVSGQLPSSSLSIIVKNMVEQISSAKSQSESDSICLGLADEIQKYLDK